MGISILSMRRLLSNNASRRCFSTGGGKTVGFIGCGNMGSGMVKNLAEKGYQVTIFDLSPAAIEAVQATSPSVQVADTPALAAAGAGHTDSSDCTTVVSTTQR